MVERTIAERAERLARKRARILPVFAVLLIVQQSSFFSDHPGLDRPVDHFKIAAWLVLSAVLLLILATGGAWLQPKEVRDLLNDDLTRANRAKSFRAAFLASMLGCIFIYFLTAFTRVGGREAVHIIMTIGLASALISFASLERRAMKDG